jgi:hypothetical protein
MVGDIKWEVSGDYFENCNCNVVCPCLVSAAAPLTSNPTQDHCDVVLAFHVDSGHYGDVKLDGLNAVLVGQSNGPMANGNMTGAAYIDERADESQAEALGAIFSGAAGGPMAVLAPLFSTNLGARKAHITYTVGDGRRSARIPAILDLRVKALPSLVEGREIWAQTGHPANPDKLALAVGEAGSTYTDYDFRWDNSGRNAHYAAIHWTN